MHMLPTASTYNNITPSREVHEWAVGSWQWAVGSGQWAVGSWQLAVGSGQLAVDNGQWAMDNVGMFNVKMC